MSGRRTFVAGLLAAAGYALTGLTVVPQDELGVVRRFGAVTTEPYRPGLHWGWPWGVERVDRLKVDQARTVTVGARGLASAPLSRAPEPGSEEFLTSDLNLVTVEALVQFRVTEPVRYLFGSTNPDAQLAALAEGALAESLAGRTIDDVLTSGRAELADGLARRVQSLSEAHGLGVSVRAVRLARVAPPTPVAPAFADAARARSDKRQAVTRAEEYRDRALADAKGRARETLDRAAGARETAVQAARGEADRFTRLLAEVRKNPTAARQRLYLDTLAELLPNFRRKVVVTPGREVDLTLLPGTDPPAVKPGSGVPEPRSTP